MRCRGDRRTWPWPGRAHAAFLPLATAAPDVPLLGPLIELTRDLGAAAPLAYAAVYVLGALIGVPAWTLTVTAGALFGPLLGFAVSSCSAVLAAGLGFVLARHVARDWIERIAGRRRMFRVLDRAITQGDWRVVALIRLSPVVPYMLSNYLFGVTGVRFWPYLLAGWIATMPGTAMYVMLGHAGRAGLEASRGGHDGFDSAEWGLLALGLAATITLVVYLTKLAKRELARFEGEVSPPAETRT